VAGIFSASEQELPLNTRMLLSTGQWLESYSLILFAVLGIVMLSAWNAYRKLPRIRYKVDSALWRIPLVRDTILARFSGLLSFQLGAGISLVQAMHGAVRGVESSFFRERMEKAADEVAAGQSLDRVLARQEIFPQMYLTALKAGQKAGQLPSFLERLGRILEREVDNTTRRIVSLVEPVLILVLGLVIGFFVLAVMGPIFDLTSGI
jgi:type II secretory pathway component PulF